MERYYKSQQEVIKMSKKKLVCPVCGAGRLMDADASVKSELCEETKMRPSWHADYFAKCYKCGKTIGIRKVS